MFGRKVHCILPKKKLYWLLSFLHFPLHIACVNPKTRLILFVVKIVHHLLQPHPLLFIPGLPELRMHFLHMPLLLFQIPSSFASPTSSLNISCPDGTCLLSSTSSNCCWTQLLSSSFSPFRGRSTSSLLPDDSCLIPQRHGHDCLIICLTAIALLRSPQ